ncbi:16S rRNA processing protein RimM [Lactobacillus colini]|uniref:Ribosome maturation factor RimM n=1 Tax=Lactobacillus colini TaxID=1819254 RepID=A0ABS4MBB4_9LACO|nr:ribosome maturation factor RimM [Lactobacillus colini]MBP2056962.1 16S rRNA processing protein RimM [Lactobacillus colini]
MNEYFEVGKILTTHGLKGEVKVNVTTDFPEERFSEGSRLFVELNGDMKELTVESARRQKQFYLVFFEGILDIDSAEKICQHELYVADEDRQDLPEGSYYFKDIIGCPVYDHDSGEKLGILNAIETPGANDIWEIKPNKGKSFWIPNITSVVNKIDLANNRIEVILLEGLR